MIKLVPGLLSSDLEADERSVSIASLVITNSRRKVLLSVGADAFPASRVSAKREQPDESLIEYIQVTKPHLLQGLAQADAWHM